MMCGKQTGSPTLETKFRVKYIMEFGWVSAKNPQENPGNFGRKSPEKPRKNIMG